MLSRRRINGESGDVNGHRPDTGLRSLLTVTNLLRNSPPRDLIMFRTSLGTPVELLLGRLVRIECLFN